MDPRVLQLTSYLFDNFEKPVCLRDMSRLVNLSDSHLVHLFRRETGMPPQKFLKTVRLEKACRLLETTFLSVKQVMAQVGFNDPSHFVREFEKMFAESPCKYREHRLQAGAGYIVTANEKQKPPIGQDCRPRKRVA
jgi:AraC family transcriptional regulator of arabinose operon